MNNGLPERIEDACITVAKKRSRNNRCAYYDFDDYLQDARLAALEAINRNHECENETLHHALFLIKKRTIAPATWRHDIEHEINKKNLDDDIPTHQMQELHMDSSAAIKALEKVNLRDAEALFSSLHISTKYKSARDMARETGVSFTRIHQLRARALNVLREELK